MLFFVDDDVLAVVAAAPALHVRVDVRKDEQRRKAVGESLYFVELRSRENWAASRRVAGSSYGHTPSISVHC
jgi:hypothetical protein